MTYTCVESRPNGLPPIIHSYQGFQGARSTDILLPDELIAFVQNEDCLDVWLLEYHEAVSELRRFYSEQRDRPKVGVVIARVMTEKLWYGVYD